MSLVPDRRPFIDPDRKQTPRRTTRAPARRVSEPARSPRQGFCASGLRPQPAFAETDPASERLWLRPLPMETGHVVCSHGRGGVPTRAGDPGTAEGEMAAGERELGTAQARSRSAYCAPRIV